MRHRPLLVVLACLLAVSTGGGARLGAAAGDDAATLRVGTSGDYAPFSTREEGRPPRYEGLDIALARAYAADRGIALEFVAFRWPELVHGLTTGRFDVAMSGVTVRPERSAAGRFSVPVVETGAVVLARDPDRWSQLRDLDRPKIRIGVNAGGHLEQVARARFSRATLLAIPDNAAVLRALLEGSVDAVVTDTAEAASWQEQAGGEGKVELIGPFTRDRKAWLVQSENAALAADLDAWLLERERDGTLPKLRAEWIPGASATVAHPLAALMAAIDERLSLMPWIGAAKRRDGLPLEVPAREEAVLKAAATAVLSAAAAADVRAPSVLDIRGFYQAQMNAAKQVQWDAVRDANAKIPEALPDLDDVLRPAILRIGERIAGLLVQLPKNLDRATIRAAAEDGLRAPYLANASRRALADALTDYVAGIPR